MRAARGPLRACGRRSAGAAAAAVALLAAALLGACAVEVEGAPCRVPGATTDCPGGQACGNDLRCSARALACESTGSRCTPGAGGACLDPDGGETTAPVARARRCTAADPVCGTWIVDPCPASGLDCAVRAPAGGAAGAWCVCPALPAETRELVARPGGSLRARPPFATGAASPAACAFGRLGDALAAAAQIVADPSAIATVTAVGAGSDPATAVTVAFSAAASGERFPLVVPGRVSLRSDAAAGGGTYQIVFDAAAVATAPLELHSGATLGGFTVRNGSGDATRDALALACDGPDPAVLTTVVLDGTGAGGARLGRGVAVVDGCGIAATGVQVRGFSGAGVLLDSTQGAQVGLTGGAVTGCGEGIVLRSGRLLLSGARIADNVGMGIRGNYDPALLDFNGNPRAEIRGSRIVGNGDAGIVLFGATELRITGTTVFRNGLGALTSFGGGLVPSGVSRKAGGLVVFSAPPSAGNFEFGRNRIYGNGGDQVLAVATPSTWVFDGPPGCGSDALGPLYTMIGCYDRTPSGSSTAYRGVVAIDAGASARNVWWDAITALQTIDVKRFPSGLIDITGYCVDAATLSCSSEPP